MTDIWTYREQTIGDIDLTGFKVEARDGDIGKIDQATYDIGRSYIVVDTGPWIFGKKVVLPAGVIERVDVENERVVVGRTKEEIKNAPEFDEARFGRDFDPEAYAPIGTYYADFYAGTLPTTGDRRDRDAL